METSSSSTMSPPRRSNEEPLVEDGPPQSRVPPPQSITSAGQVTRPPLPMLTSPLVASARYFRQFQDFMEHQRQVFDEERALWNIERTELYEKIAQLETSFRQYQAHASSQMPVSSNNSASAAQNKYGFWSSPSKEGSGHISATGSGDEIWRGPKNVVQPSRTFSDPTTQITKPGERSRLFSIAEDTTCGRKDPSDVHSGLHRSSLSGAKIDRNLDGINFKSTVLSPASTKKIMTPQSPSPRTSSPSHLSPKTIELPFSEFEAALDPYTRDAGHTPLARRTYFNADGASTDGNGSTPTQPEMERPPLEPRVSLTRIPSERSDSYFPVATDEMREGEGNSEDQNDNIGGSEDRSRDEDPELKGPLGLDDSEGGNIQFLRKVNSKLEDHARSEASGSSRVDLDAEISPVKVDRDLEEPEHEPKLRIKRSMNFGSAFGAKTCGKGI